MSSTTLSTRRMNLERARSWQFQSGRTTQALELDAGTQDVEEFRKPSRICRPSRASHEIAINNGVGHGDLDVASTRELNIGSDRRIATAFSPLENLCSGEDLRAVTKRGDGLVGRSEVPDDLKHLGIETKVLGRASTWDDKGIVVLRFNLVEGRVEGKVMAAFFGIRLVAFEIVNCRANCIPCFLSGTDGVHSMTDHEQGLKWDHHFIVFNVVAN